METLIHWYDLKAAEGHPDYRVIPVIKAGARRTVEVQLDAEGAHVRLQPLAAAAEPESLATPRLNNLVSVAYAWYWLQTGDNEERDRGDEAVRARLRRSGRLRVERQAVQPGIRIQLRLSCASARALNSSTVLPENNPYTGPYADTVPPISEKVNCDPNYYRGCKAGTIGSTTATIFWGTYKPATTQVIYGKSTDYGQSSTARQEHGARSTR